MAFALILRRAAAARSCCIHRFAAISCFSSSSSSIGRCYLFPDNAPSLLLLSQQHLFYSSSSTTKHRLKKPTYSNNISDIVTPQFFIHKYDFSPDSASKVASHSASLNNSLNSDLVLSFLQQEYGFSNTQLERIVTRYPKVLSMCPRRIVEPKIRAFQEFGCSAGEVTDLLARDPRVLNYGVDRIILSLTVLKRVLGSNEDVILLLKKYRSTCNLFYTDLEKTMLPNIEFLKSCGVLTQQITGFIYIHPEFFLRNPESMRKFVHKVDKMGVDRTSNLFIHAVRAVSEMSGASLELKLRAFQDLGFSEYEILRLFQSSPMVLAVSVPKLKEVKEVLLETGKYDMSCIVKNPQSLMCSVEKRYKPRVHVLKVLEKKGLIKKWPALSTLSVISTKYFFRRFVASYMNEFREDVIVKTAFGAQDETKALL